MKTYRNILISQIIILISIMISAFTEKYMIACVAVPIFSVYTIGEVIRMRSAAKRGNEK